MIDCNCELGPGTVTIPVNPVSAKVIDYCKAEYQIVGETKCRCGQFRVISSCDSAGVITELSRVLLGDDCRVVTVPYALVDCSAIIKTVCKCETLSVNFDLCPTADTSYSIMDLVQKALDSGSLLFPSGNVLTITPIVSDLVVGLMWCGSKCNGGVTTKATATIQIPGSSISLEQGGSREFKADCGSAIQTINAIDVKAGSGVAICIQFSNYIQCVV